MRIKFNVVSEGFSSKKDRNDPKQSLHSSEQRGEEYEEEEDEDDDDDDAFNILSPLSSSSFFNRLLC